MDDLFLESIPYMFDSGPQRYLMSHYLWDSSERLEHLVIHLRMYDLVSRMYFVQFQ